MQKGTIENLAFGGQGILRHQGLVIFIPFSAQGEEVLFQITEKKARYAKGEILDILQASPNRIVPHCPYFGTCGGCQLQHLKYETQLEHKKQCVEDALNRIGHLAFDRVLPTIPAQQWEYRRHVTLSLKPIDNHFQAGYIAIDNENLVEINCCPIFIHPTNEIIRLVREIASALDAKQDNEGKVTLFKLTDESFLLYFRFKFLPKNFPTVIKDYLNPPCSGIMVSSPNKTLSWGQTEGTLEIEGRKFLFSPTMFIQNHPEQSLNIYRHIMSIAAGFGPQKILDLYSGVGISSILLAQQHQVVGVEYNREAIHYAKKNSDLNNCNHLRFVQADVQKVLPTLLTEFNPFLLIVNPPRTGLDPNVIQSLLANPPPVILYISCLPSTLARDLKMLCKEQYALELVQPYDMFPQTAHVETLVVLKRKAR